MNNFSSSALRKKLSLYIDGELEQKEAEKLERLIESDRNVARQLSELRYLQNQLRKSDRPKSNRFFYAELLQRIEKSKGEEENLLPFPRKLGPLLTAVSIVAITLLGVILVELKIPVKEYFAEKSQEIQKAYDENLLKGSVLPLFSNVDKNHVLQFALFGTIPLDAKAQTTLTVDEDGSKGYRLEVGKGSPKSSEKVTVQDLYKEIQPTESQLATIDSLLEDTRERIASSAYYAENNTLAIDPSIVHMTRLLVSNIAAQLDPLRRARFDQYLKTRDAAYAIPASRLANRPERFIERAEQAFSGTVRTPHERTFLVITPDSVMLSKLHVEFEKAESLRKQFFGGSEEFHKRIEEFITQFEPYEDPVPRPNLNRAVDLVGGSGFFRIHINRDEEAVRPDSMVQWTIPRARRLHQPRQVIEDRRNRLLQRERIEGEHEINPDSLFEYYFGKEQKKLEKENDSLLSLIKWE